MSLFLKIGHVFYSVGFNQYNIDLKNTSLHAEVDAVNKLKPNHKTKSKKVIIIVFRVNNSGTKLLMSKPCSCCIATIKKSLSYKNYTLHKGWYTETDGNYKEFYI